MQDQHGTLTRLLDTWRRGDQEAGDELFARVYQELRTMAQRYLSRERIDHTLQPTALVHEAYFRLIDQQSTEWQGRGHFFAVAAQAMRRILVDHARKLRYATCKRPWRKVQLDDASSIPRLTSPDHLLALDDSLKSLASVDPQKAKIVELRFFAGLSVEETAAAVGCSRATIIRQWRMAKAWLHLNLNESTG